MKQRLLIFGGLLLSLIGGYLLLNQLLFDGVKPRAIHTEEFQGQFYALGEAQSVPTILLLGDGSWSGYWGSELAKEGFAALTLPYCCQEGLPPLPEAIPLEYLEAALRWLATQPEVNPDQILVMGASRNAELALVAAAYLPDLLHGAIAYAPSSVSWSNTVLPYNSDELKPSWTYQGKAIPFVAMEKWDPTDTPSSLTYWEAGLAQDSLGTASIPVERISGPILLFSGKEDQVWPASYMGQQLEARLEAQAFGYEFQHLAFEDAGHLISGNPSYLNEQRSGQLTVAGVTISYPYGGTAEGDQAAQLAAKARVLELLQQLKEEK